jgi:hypothetical protein
MRADAHPSPSDDSANGVSAPLPLKVAAAIALVQGVVLVGLAVAETASLDVSRLEMGTTTAFFFAAYGLGLLACAWALVRRRTWGRGPVLLAQFVQLGLAWNFRDGMLWLSAVLAVAALVALVCLVQRDSIAALEQREIETG